MHILSALFFIAAFAAALAILAMTFWEERDAVMTALGVQIAAPRPVARRRAEPAFRPQPVRRALPPLRAAA